MVPILVINLILVVITVLLAIADYYLIPQGECKIIINKERIIPVESGRPLLSYLVENKIYIPSACGGKATCGHCKVKVLSGAYKILPTEEVFISAQEKTAGIRLACQVKVKNDIEIYLPEHLLEAKEYVGIVEKITSVTHDIKHIIIKLLEPDTINFKPGQYVQLKVPGTEEFRSYSLASSPSQKNKIELTIRLVPGGLCSTYVNKALDVGDKVVFTGPFGEFYLQEESTKDILCIAGGCGMAPIRSIILYLAEQGMKRKVTFFFGARAKRDLFFTEELRYLEKKFSNFKYIPALSEPKAEDKWDGEVGLITQVVEKYIYQIKRDGLEVYLADRFTRALQIEAYLCGPPPMIDAAVKVLTKHGVLQEEIYYEKF